MNKHITDLADKLAKEHSLSAEEYLVLIEQHDEEDAQYLAQLAREQKEAIYGKDIFIRGLIEISNYCKNDCFYCGIRRSNKHCDRYRLTDEEILECCKDGYDLGFRTFVMQGGEDTHFDDDRMCNLISRIKADYPDCAVTLSLGERSSDSYRRMKEAGADRYLLRHEAATPEHYAELHPKEMSFDNRMECLRLLRKWGYQVGCGFMVNSPFQTTDMLARELKFIEKFKPDMCGIGPFIPHKDTPFGDYEGGSVELTCLLISCIRLIHPNVLLPSTTALGTLHPQGREMGILAGANVVMPNLSPASVRKKYMLYDNKLSDGAESAQAIASLKKRMEAIGCSITTDRGDIIKDKKEIQNADI